MSNDKPDEKPVHIPRERYPEAAYPATPAVPHRSYYEDDEEDSIHLLDYWHVLVARRWTVLAVFVTVVTVTAIATFKQTPIYRSSSTIQIDRENSNVLSFKDVYEIESATDDTLQTQYKVLESRSLARRVINELHLDAEFLSEESSSLRSYLAPLLDWFSPPESDPVASDPMRPLIDAYLNRLTVSPVRQARLVQISFESEDPRLAAEAINAHGRNYIEQNFEFKLEATKEAERFLQTEVNKLKATVEDSEDKLQAYSREKQILITEQGQNTATDQLHRLQEEYNRFQSDLVEKKSYYDLIQDGQSEALPQLRTNSLIAELSSKLADREKEEARLRVTYGPEWPERKRILSEIVTIGESIREEKDKITATAIAEYTAAERRERAYFNALEAQRALVETLNQDFIQYNILKREADSNKMIYESLLQRQKEAAVSASLRASNIRIVDRGEVPNRPVKPRKGVNIALGAIVGLVFGIGLAFFQEYLDNSLKSPEDVARFLKLATLGTIPNLDSLNHKSAYGYGYRSSYSLQGAKNPDHDKKRVSLDMISHGSPSSLMAEAYRSMRTSLLLSSADQPPRLIVITSAVPSEGKTVTAANLAISLAQAANRVALIDGDMRKPRMHGIFSLGDAPGLSGFLSGSATLKEVLHETSVPNLFVLPCGVLPPNPTELILSNRFKQLLAILPQYFDHIVIDSPPVTNVSDARVLASKADATILVVKAFSTSRHLGQRAVNLLLQSRVRIAGVILNDLNVRARTGYYSAYSGRYHYTSKYDYSQRS